MVKKSISLPYNHVSVAAEQAVKYIEGRRTGKIQSLQTGKKKLDKALLTGVEWNRIFSICGLSGSGKSTICEELKRNFIQRNPEQKFKVLSFEFEMLGQDQALRNISGKLEKSTKYILSAEDNKISSAEMGKIEAALKEYADYPIYYVDQIGTVDEVVATVDEFAQNEELLEKGEGLIVTIDHVLLTKGRMGEDEKQTIDNLMHACVTLKKRYAAMGIPILIIVLGQLNRNIETPDRVLNPQLHYPTKNDIFGASSLFYSSDYVLITHKPAVVDGIKSYYGPSRVGYPNGLPVFNPYSEEQAMVYWHLIKERFGNPKIMMMLDEFKYSRVGEFEPLEN